MTRLRKMMLEELQRLNYAQNTIRNYVRTVEDFARRFNCSPDRLGPRVTHTYIKASSNQRSTTSREASAAGRLRPNELTAEVGSSQNLSNFWSRQRAGRNSLSG